MQFIHDFTVPAAVDQAWMTLLDIPRIAGCLPGATIDEQTGDEYTGRLKVKVGPISMAYGGVIALKKADRLERIITLVGNGRDSHGAGTARATITAQLEADGGERTRVTVTTDLEVTGKPAQFGRGVLADVGGKLIDRFAGSLAQMMAGTSTDEAKAMGPDGVPDGAALQMGAVIAVPILKRILPVAAALVAIAVAYVFIRSRRQSLR